MVDQTTEIVKQFVYCLFRGHSMMPVLYYTPPSPPCRAVLMLGRILGIEFTLKEIDETKGEHLKPDFIQMNPQHCLPTLEENDFIMWESRAIMCYLVSLFGKDDSLYPKDIRIRAMVDQRLYFDIGTLYQRLLDYFIPTIMVGAPLDEAKKNRLSEALGWFEIALKGRIWSAAPQFTIADLSLCVTVSQIDAFGFDLGPYPKIRTWFQRCKDELAPYGYEEINQMGADILGGAFKANLQMQ